MDARELRFPDNSFDAALMLGGTIMNLYPLEQQTIKEAYRVLKKGGRSFFTTAKKEAQQFHEEFYHASNLPIRNSYEDLITLKTGLISKRHSQEELTELLQGANITNYKISNLTEHTYQVHIYKD